MSKAFESATNTYTISGTIGEGGSGVVYRVSDAGGETFALKLLRNADSKRRRRFKNELAFCRRNVHDRVVTALHEGIRITQVERLPFYVMRLYQSTLRKQIEEGMAPSGIMLAFSDILDGVEAAHLKGVTHRDLKPENILVELPSRRLAIADFGIAHFEEDDLATAVETGSAERLANFRYSAPEQRTKGGVVDQRADIFALGLILNEMFTQQVPQGTGHTPIAAVAPEFAYLDPIVDQMIRQNAAERYPTIAAVKQDLELRTSVSVTYQKLDSVTRAVIPTESPEDPLGGTIVEAVGFDYIPGYLTFRFEPQPPANWLETLRTLRDFRSFMGSEPSALQMTSDGARVPANERTVVETVGMVKEWTNSANRKYREVLQQKALEQELLRRRTVQAERARLEETARVQEILQRALNR
jgi:serine/threonine protein kinase